MLLALGQRFILWKIPRNLERNNDAGTFEHRHLEMRWTFRRDTEESQKPQYVFEVTVGDIRVNRRFPCVSVETKPQRKPRKSPGLFRIAEAWLQD